MVPSTDESAPILPLPAPLPYHSEGSVSVQRVEIEVKDSGTSSSGIELMVLGALILFRLMA